MRRKQLVHTRRLLSRTASTASSSSSSTSSSSSSSSLSSTPSNSRVSFKDIQNNKHGLSYELDITMREGHHDMKTFGLGFLRSVSSKEHQIHTLASLHTPYAAMELSLDEAVQKNTNIKLGRFWSMVNKDLEKSNALKEDVQMLGGSNNELHLPAADRYVSAIHRAAANRCNENNPGSEGDLLLAHMYVRYLADLFGGSMLGRPTELALGLKANSLKFYTPNNGPHEQMIKYHKLQFIELFYDELNKCGLEMTAERRQQVVQEAIDAFKLNADIFTEKERFLFGAAKGGFKLVSGYFNNLLSSSSSSFSS